MWDASVAYTYLMLAVRQVMIIKLRRGLFLTSDPCLSFESMANPVQVSIRLPPWTCFQQMCPSTQLRRFPTFKRVVNEPWIPFHLVDTPKNCRRLKATFTKCCRLCSSYAHRTLWAEHQTLDSRKKTSTANIANLMVYAALKNTKLRESVYPRTLSQNKFGEQERSWHSSAFSRYFRYVNAWRVVNRQHLHWGRMP